VTRRTKRNDRIVTIEQDAHSWEDIKTIDELGKQFVRELENFFVNYHQLSGKQYRVLGLRKLTGLQETL
jgi:inorganic pyrophosphatase